QQEAAGLIPRAIFPVLEQLLQQPQLQPHTHAEECLLRVPNASLPWCATRRYYLGAVELSWNYMQSDLLSVLHTDSRFHPRMSTSFPFNTSIMYKKTVFVEYTDQLFSIAKPRPPWMELLLRIVGKKQCSSHKLVHQPLAHDSSAICMKIVELMNTLNDLSEIFPQNNSEDELGLMESITAAHQLLL
ncbi:ceruloplasmin-like, partial [Grammomys surdaster]|uniref:ceruloplasmin-like n=1 Tax=Grammomys surdaster TaxID=491861 RepID=UPI00109EFF56